MDDDDDNRDSGASSVPQGPAMGPIYTMWENALEKLKVLNYEKTYCIKGKKRLNRIHFVLPAANLSHQFDDFVDICSWLFAEITHDRDYFKRDQYDDPNAVSNKIMLALRGLDFRLSFPPQKLKAAHGESVCSVLEFLTDKALQESGFQWKAPIYADADEVDQQQSNGKDQNDNDNDNIEDEVLGGAIEEEAMFDEIARNDIGELSLDSSAHNILHAQVDPIEWKTELERVGPKLKVPQQLSTNEWRSHVDQIVSSKGYIEKILVDAQNDLLNVNRTVLDDITRTKTKEKYINHQFSNITGEYKKYRTQIEEIQSSGSKSNENVTKLTNQLAEITEKLDDLKDSFESKDSGIHDTSPLVRIKASLQQIKSEVSEFDLRIGVVGHNLMAAKISASNVRRKGAVNKAKQRRNKNKSKEDDIDFE